MYMKNSVLMLILCVVWCAEASEIRVVATVPNAGVLARAIGGDQVQVKVLAPPDRDAHYLEARPSMMSALRRADLLVAIGADLEIGWLPAAIRGAQNARIQPGQPAYFELASALDLLEKGKPADRALGDVHPHGNPHFDYDPVRLAEAGLVLAERWAVLYPEHAETFRAGAHHFMEQARKRLAEWKMRIDDPAPVLAYHADFVYLLDALNVQSLGAIEPLPGIPPTASHLQELVHRLAGEKGVIWATDYQPSQAGQFMARALSWTFIQMPIQAPIDAEADAYFNLIETWVNAIVHPNE